MTEAAPVGGLLLAVQVPPQGSPAQSRAVVFRGGPTKPFSNRCEAVRKSLPASLARDQTRVRCEVVQ